MATLNVDPEAVVSDLTAEAESLNKVITDNRERYRSIQSAKGTVESLIGYLTDPETNVAALLSENGNDVDSMVTEVSAIRDAIETATQTVEPDPLAGQLLATQAMNLRQAVALGLLDLEDPEAFTEALDAALASWADVAGKVKPGAGSGASGNLPGPIDIIREDGVKVSTVGSKGFVTKGNLRQTLVNNGVTVPDRDTFFAAAVEDLRTKGETVYRGWVLRRSGHSAAA